MARAIPGPRDHTAAPVFRGVLLPAGAYRSGGKPGEDRVCGQRAQPPVARIRVPGRQAQRTTPPALRRRAGRRRVEIPMIGTGASLNVAVAGSLVVYRLAGFL
jgi:hypothetical protein